MSKNVLVIGNGYDLAHGLKTSYLDFINYAKKHTSNFGAELDTEEIDNKIKQCTRYNGFMRYFVDYTNMVYGWVDFEQEIKRIAGAFEYLFANEKDIISRRYGIIAKNKCDVYVWNTVLKFDLFEGDMNTIKSIYYSQVYGLNKNNILKYLKSQLDELIQAMRIYFKIVMKNSNVSPKEQIAAIVPSYVISFNYTDTYKFYGIDEKDVFHVHGSLDKDNMVLGFNDTDPDKLDFVYFKKYFQRIQKLTGYIDSSKMYAVNEIGEHELPVIYFYGHSMDKTDEDIIKQLKTMSKGFVIYKYSQEDYEQKVVNLIDIFGKDNAMNMIQEGTIRFVPCEKEVAAEQ